MRTSDTKQSRFTLNASLFTLLFLCGLAPVLQAATGTNIQSTGTTASWTDNANWNGASYPGFGATETAFLTTNMVGGGGYTNILNATLPNALTTLSLSNFSGTATLIVTNNSLTAGTVNLGTGGRLQVEVAAHPSFTPLTVTTLNMYGLDPKITINNGARLATTTALIFTNGSDAATGLVVCAAPGADGSAWDSATAITIGSGGVTGKVLTIDGGGAVGGLVVTHGGADLNIGGLGVNANNSLNLINGARLNLSSVVANTPNLYVGRLGATNTGNRLTVDNAVLEGSSLRIHVGNAPATTGAGPNGGNTMVVTNGGSVNAIIVNVGGYYVSGTITYGSSNNTLMVVGTNSSGVRSSIALGSGAATWSGIGNAAGAVSNLAVIDNGVVTIGGNLTVGRGAQANFNQLVVTNGGQLVTSGTLFYIGGAAAGASGNSVLLSGAGSLWNMGASTRLEIGSSGCTNNTMTVEGGSVLSNVNALFVGYNSISNELRILNGGRVEVVNEVRAPYTGGASNKIIVDNATLLCGELSVGTGSGGGNNILITNGASVTATSLYVGRTSAGAGGSNNWITVAGTNSSGARATLSLANGAIGVGSFNAASGFDNRLTIGRGGIMPDVGGVVVGVSGVTTGNVLSIDGGVMTNVSLDVRNNNSLIFSGGTLAMGSATCSNSVDVPVFNVGDGTQAATLLALTGGGTFDFFGGMLINSNATVGGIGTFTCRVPGGSALTLTNGATVAPGLGGPGFLTVLKDLVWSGGGIYQCDITDVAGGEGIGWDSLVLQSSLTLTNAAAKQMVIKLDSRGVNTANFNPTQNYALKIASYVAVTNFVSANFLVDTNAFLPVSSGTWSVSALNGGLYVMYNGGGVAPTADYTWAVPSNGLWSANQNWTNPATAPADGGNAAWTLTFGGNDAAYISTNDRTPGFQFSNLVFSSSFLTATNLITGSNLVFAGTGGGIQQWDAGTFRVSNSITLNTDLTFSGPGLGSVILHTNISGPGGLTKLDAGKLVLQGTNTFTGPVLVNGNGTLEAANARALGVNSVTVSNGTLLVSSGAATVMELGRPGLASRAALVTGSGSLWTNVAIFKVSTNTSFNTLTIVNTGRLYNAAAVSFVGDNSPSNTAVVKDGGLWSLGTSILTVGRGAATGNVLRVEGGVVTNAPITVASGGGQMNSLIVTNGGRVYGSASIIGDSSSNNTALVKDNGYWNLGGSSLYVGNGGATGNTLTVDGGVVTNISSGALLVGRVNASVGATGNGLIITNGGQLWTAVAYAGSGSSNNYTIVEGSNSTGRATLSCTTLNLGDSAGSQGNWMRVGSDGYLIASLSMTIAGLGNNYLVITNGGAFYTGNSAASLIGGTSSNHYVVVSGSDSIRPSTWLAGGSVLTIGDTAATGNWMRVDNGALATNFNAVTIGSGGKAQYNTLTITNGGRLYSTAAGTIGATSSSNNTVVISGANGAQPALWYMAGQTLAMGAGSATGNVLRIGNGGVLSNAILSFSTLTPNNSVEVESGGKAYAGLYVGNSANYITNPAITVAGVSLWEPGSEEWNAGGNALRVGYNPSTGNVAILNGRTFTNFSAVNIGYPPGYDTGRSDYNVLGITNGAKLYSGASTIGFVNGTVNRSAGNSAFITGGEGVTSLWDCSSTFVLSSGGLGISNSLTIDGRGVYGSAVLTNTGTFSILSDISSLIVTNGGVAFLRGGLLFSGKNGSLLITKGSSVLFQLGGWGSYLSMASTNNLLLVSGSNSLLEARGTVAGTDSRLVLGYSNNTLRIEDGAVVSNTSVTVGGVPTAWPATPNGNTMSITGGGKLYAFGVINYIGGASLARANTGLVSGVGSYWDGGGYGLYMYGFSNVLTLSGGAVVTNVTTVNLGAGATVSESYNQMIITNGGKLYSSGAVLMGNAAAQSSNSVLVTGSTSVWSLAAANLTLGTGLTTTGNVLRIEQGGTVDGVGTLTINSNNAVNLNGGTLALNAANVAQGPIFVVGDGTQPATLKSLLAGGICRLTNGVWVREGSTLTGVGTVVGGVPGVILTNGAILSAGLNGVGTLTLSNTTWYGGATNVVEITAVDGTAGVGYDTVNVNTQLTMTANGKKFVVKMDSLLGSANFQTGRNYLLKFMSCSTSAAAFNLGDFEVDATAFVPGGTWWVTNIGYSLYLATTGGTPVTSSYVWDSTKNGAWDVNGNWLGGVAPNPGDVTNVLEFGGAGAQTYTATNNLGDDYPLKSLRLTSTSTGTNYLFGQSLLFSGSGSGIALDGSGWTTSTNRMNWTAPLLLGGSGAGGGIILSNCLVGTGAVTVASGGTYIMAVSNAFKGDVTLDCSGDGKLRVNNVYGLGSNSVTVSNGTLHINQAASIFGNTNQANLRGLVTGVSSVWSNNGTLTVGTLGATNVSLTLNAGSTMYGTTVTIGGPGSTNSSLLLTNTGRIIASAVVGDQGGVRSTAILTGVGSLWQAAALSVGATGAGVASGNVLRVESGAVITNVAAGIIGNGQSGNSLIITNGGKYYSPRGAVTVGAGTASNNAVVVSGSGSRLDAYLNNNNSFIVGNGTPTVICSNNVVTVSDGGLIQEFTMVFGYGNNYRSKLVVDNGTVGPCGGYALTFGYPGNGNEGIVSNGGQILLNVTLAYSSGGTNNTLKVFGSNSLLFYPYASGSMLIGNAGNSVSNQVLIDAGMMTNYATVTVGVGTNTYGNSLILTNGGRAWMGTPGLTIGQGNYSGPNWVGVYDNAMIDSKNYAISIGAGLGTGSNRLEVGIGGSVTNVGTLTVGNPTSSNQLTIIGGTLSVSNLVCSNVNNTIAFSAGKMNLRGAYVSNTVPLVVGDGAQAATLSLVAGGTSIFAHGLTITNKATLTGAGAITGNTTVYGTNSPGMEGIGVITNSGNVTLAASAVSRFEIAANTTAGSGWDLLAVTDGGTLTLGGTLKPILLGGFMPTNTMSFVIMTNTTANVSGSFANETSGKVNVYTNDSLTSLVGAFDVAVSNSQYVVLTNFKPPLASGTVFKFR